MLRKACPLFFAFALVVAPGSLYAKGGQGKGKNAKKVNEKLVLVDGAAEDLASSSGRVRSFPKSKGTNSVRVNVKLPVAASIGLIDDASAALAQIRAEFSREGVPYASCLLEYIPSDDLESDAPFKFRLRAKIHKGVTTFKRGACDAEASPAIEKGDGIRVFSVDGSLLETDILAN